MKSPLMAVLSAFLAAAPVAAQHQGHEGHGAGAQQLHESMTKGAQEMQSMDMSGDLDRDFVKSMLMHHRHGVEMAKIQAEHGSDAKAKSFAKKIIDAQTKEIKQLEGWLQAHPEGEGQKR